MSPNYERYLAEVVNTYDNHHPHLRWGQTYFNILVDFQPNLAMKVRGTDLDPYHKKDNELEPFISYITTRWGMYD
jgi:hypothetical protein